MSEISYINMPWVLEIINNSKKHGDKHCEISGGPCCSEIISELKSVGYTVEEYSDFEIISW